MPTKQSQINQLLIDGFAKGNQKAFRRLYELFWESMFIEARIIVGDENEAKDIVQDIWIRLWQQRETLEVKNFKAYSSKAVRNECYKFFRDNKFSLTQLSVIETLQPLSNCEIVDQHNLEDTQSAILQSLGKLPKRCKQIFELSRTDHYTNEDIANELGISKRSVENQISLAVKSIKSSLMMFLVFLIS